MIPMFESLKKKVDPEIKKIEDDAKEQFYKKTKNEAYKNHVQRVFTERAERDAKNLAEQRWGNKPLLQGITKLIPKMSEEDKKKGTGILQNFADFYKNLSEDEMVVVAARRKKQNPHPSANPNNTYDDIVPEQEPFDVALVRNMKKKGVNDMSDLL